jgi:hypothetical protein
MTNLQYKLKKWEAATVDLADEFAKEHFGHCCDSYQVRFASDIPGDFLFIGDMSFGWNNVLEYIREGATTDEIYKHYDYCIEHKYVRFDYWRSEIKPKTETQPVEARVIKNEQL